MVFNQLFQLSYFPIAHWLYQNKTNFPTLMPSSHIRGYRKVHKAARSTKAARGTQTQSYPATRDFTQELQGREPCVSWDVTADFLMILSGLKSSELVHLGLKCLSNKINIPATSSHRADFFRPQRARQSHSKVLHICKPKPAVGPAGHSLCATQSKHLPRATAWHCSHPHFHSGMPLASRDDGYFLLMLPMEKQTNTHTPSDSPVTWLLLGGGKLHPASRKLLLGLGRRWAHQVSSLMSCSATNFLLKLGKVALLPQFRY